MRRISLMLFALLCCVIAVGAQETIQVRGTVIHKQDKQPMVGAEVKVKGTTIATITNVDGQFLIEAPADARKLEISYVGMPSTTATIKPGEELLIKMQPAERTFMPFVSVSPLINGFVSSESEFIGFGVNLSLGLTCNITNSFAITPAVEIGKSFIFFEDNIGCEFWHKPLHMQIPVMFEVGSWVRNTTKFIVGIGSYVGFNLGSSDGEITDYCGGSQVHYYPFRENGELERKSFEAGIRLGYKMHWTHFLLGVHAQYGLTKAFEKDIELDQFEKATNIHPLQVGISLGYRF